MFGIHFGNDTVGLGDHNGTGVTGDTGFQTGTHIGSLGLEKRHGLTTHVGTHQRTVGVVVFEEGDGTGGGTDQLLRGDVHVLDLFTGMFFGFAFVTAHDHGTDETVVLIEQGVCLGDNVLFFLVGGQIIDLIGDLTIHDLAVGSFEEAVFIDDGVERHGGDQTDVRTFGGFDRADTSIVAGVNVADFKSGTVTGKTAGTESGETAFVGQFAQGVSLIHELAQLAAGKEVTDDAGKSLGVDQFGGGHIRFIESHAFTDETFGAEQTGTALVLEQFAHGTDTACAEVVDVIDGTAGMTELNEHLGGGHEVLGIEDTQIGGQTDIQTFIEFETAHGTEVITAGIEEEPFDEQSGVGKVQRIAGAHTLIDGSESLFFGTDLIFTHTADHVVCTVGNIGEFHTLDTGIGEQFQMIFSDLGQFFDDHDIIFVGHVVDGVIPGSGGIILILCGDLFILEQRGQGVALDFVAFREDRLVGGEADGAQESGDIEFPAAATAVKVDMDVVIGIELHIHPGTAVGNDAVAVKGASGGVAGLFKADARRTVQLTDDNPFRTVDDKGALIRHQRDIAHIDGFAGFGTVDFQTEIDIERSIVDFAVFDAIDDVGLGFAGNTDLIRDEFQTHLFVETFDGEDFIEDFLESLILPFFRFYVALEEIAVGVDLKTDQIRNFQHIAKFTKVDSLCHKSPVVDGLCYNSIYYI